jgi:acyl-coenzyme A synthetase/AMP-(fatty) acid ligase
MCNPRTKIETLTYQVNFIKPRLILAEENLKEHFADNCYTNTDVIAQSTVLDQWYHSVITQDNDIAFMLWTSGTTGRTKAAMHTHSNAIQNSHAFSSVIPQTAEDRVYSTAKLFFAYGINVTLFNTLWHGSCCYIDSGLATPNRIKKNIDTFNPTLFFSVPVIYSQLASTFDTIDIQAKCVSAGDNLPELLINKWNAVSGQGIRNVFGTTESLTVTIFNNNSTSSLGQAVPGTLVRVVDEQGVEVPVGHPGLLQIKATSNALGYYNDPEWTSKTFKEWMLTGDLVYCDNELNFHYLGRTADSIKINGQYVNPVKIEESLQAFPGIEQAAVIAKSGTYGVLQIEAFVVPATQCQIALHVT